MLRQRDWGDLNHDLAMVLLLLLLLLLLLSSLLSKPFVKLIRSSRSKFILLLIYEKNPKLTS